MGSSPFSVAKKKIEIRLADTDLKKIRQIQGSEFKTSYKPLLQVIIYNGTYVIASTEMFAEFRTICNTYPL